MAGEDRKIMTKNSVYVAVFASRHRLELGRVLIHSVANTTTVERRSNHTNESAVARKKCQEDLQISLTPTQLLCGNWYMGDIVANNSPP